MKKKKKEKEKERWSNQKHGQVPHIYNDERYNDIFFLPNGTIGWTVNGLQGAIYKTVDSGDTWKLQFAPPGAHFRSVKFIDENRGWAGTVGRGKFGATDSNVLYETYDGGVSWGPVPIGRFSGSLPAGADGFGLCGMRVIGDSMVVAVGRVRGPSVFIVTTDRGATWRAKDMNELARGGLVDVHFFDADNGLAVGATSISGSKSKGIVLATADGGKTWEKRHQTAHFGEFCWKISFPTKEVGYVALQRTNKKPVYFLKTYDGGNTWEEKLFSDKPFFMQGIGFATTEQGWAGGDWTQHPRQTTDGGETWVEVKDDLGLRVNRFQFLDESTGFACGEKVYRYKKK